MTLHLEVDESGLNHEDSDKRVAEGKRRQVGGEWEHRMQELSRVIINLYDEIHDGLSPEEATWKTKLFF